MRRFISLHPFTLMTDHKNLQYIYEATAPKIIRWRLRLQMMFEFDLIHFLGRDNVIADALSRLLALRVVSSSEIGELPEEEKRRIFDNYYNALTGHHGFNKTIAKINAVKMSWLGIHKDDVGTLISQCSICQKIRIGQGSVMAALATGTWTEDCSNKYDWTVTKR